MRKIQNRPKIEIKYIVNALNFHEIPDMIKLGKKLDVDLIQFVPMFAIPQMDKLILRGDNILKCRAILEDLRNKKDKFTSSHTNLGELIQLLSRTKNIDRKDNVFLCQNSIIYRINKFGRGFRCPVGWYGAIINLCGDVYNCCHYDMLSGGNVYHSKFSSIWLGKRMMLQRKKLKYELDVKGKFWQLCHNCTQLDFINKVNLDIDKIHPKQAIV